MSQSKSAEMKELAIKAAKNAHTPYSNVQVGCAVMAESGKIYSGCNIENASFGATICGERVAIFNAISSGEKKITKLYLYTKEGWPPCGMCRQVMAEFATADLEIVVINGKNEEKKYTLEEIFPLSFTPEEYHRG